MQYRSSACINSVLIGWFQIYPGVCQENPLMMRLNDP